MTAILETIREALENDGRFSPRQVATILAIIKEFRGNIDFTRKYGTLIALMAQEWQDGKSLEFTADI